MKLDVEKTEVMKYYRSVAAGYRAQYEPGYEGYPANLLRLEMVIRRAKELGSTSLLDCGCGEGTPMRRLNEAGLEVWGFDFEPHMVALARENLRDVDMEDHVWQGDITDEAAFAPTETNAPAAFDICMATGVFPHIRDEIAALRNMATSLSSDGRLLIEFRNSLFGLFTLNRHSFGLFRDDLVEFEALRTEFPDESEAIDAMEDDLKSYFRLDLPPVSHGSEEEPTYDEILASFHNPLEIGKLFEEAGLRHVRNHFYHYHRLPPLFEAKYPDLFRAASLQIEKPDDWRGNFMCSAFVAEASLQ